MRNKSLLSLLSVLSILVLVSCDKDPVSRQSEATIVSQKLMGGIEDESIKSVISTPDGGRLITGTTKSSNSGDVRANHGSGTVDWWVIRLNNNNDTLWTRVLGGNGNEGTAAAAATPDGGFVITGYTDSHNSGDVGANHSINYPDCWVVKLTAAGDIAWTRVLGGTQQEHANAITVTTDGSIVIVARTTSSNGDVTGSHGSADDFWIVKLSSSGQLLWQKALGGSGHDGAGGVVPTADGGVVVVGYSWSNDGDVGTIIGQYDGWVLKLDANGTIVWKKVIGGTGMDWINAISKTNDEGFIIVGSSRSDNGNVGANRGEDDGWVVKLKNNGDVAWYNSFGGTSYDGFYTIIATPDGGYLAGGYTESDNTGDVGANKGDSDGWLVKLDANGQKSWSRNIGGIDFEEICGIALNNDGSFTIGGSTWSSNSGDVKGNNHGNGTGDAWVVKIK